MGIMDTMNPLLSVFCSVNNFNILQGLYLFCHNSIKHFFNEKTSLVCSSSIIYIYIYIYICVCVCVYIYIYIYVCVCGVCVCVVGSIEHRFME